MLNIPDLYRCGILGAYADNNKTLGGSGDRIRDCNRDRIRCHITSREGASGRRDEYALGAHSDIDSQVTLNLPDGVTIVGSQTVNVQVGIAAIETTGDDSHADGRVYPVSRIAGRFIQAIRSGGTAGPNLEDGLRVQVLLDALRLADRTGS